ncbi:MAG TPA: hypothetical protein PKM21_02595 [Anaerolineales bacterium]|nr:hypothetical protein [Anaerolineales bacterium]
MIKTQLSARDYEVLSAYLDGQLNSKERARLEARLITTPALQTTLDDLQKTRSLLRSLPRPRRPRSFVLTPQMVTTRQPKPRPLFPAFSLASAVSSLLLVLVMLGDFLGLAPRAVQYAMPEHAQPVALEAPQPEAAVNDAGMAQEAAVVAETMLVTETADVAFAQILPTASEADNLAMGGALPSEEPSAKIVPTEVINEPIELPVEPSPAPVDIVGISASLPIEPITPTIAATQDATTSRALPATATPTMTPEATATPTILTPTVAMPTFTETAEAAALAILLDTATPESTATSPPPTPTVDTDDGEPATAIENQPTSQPEREGDALVSTGRSGTLLTIEIVLGALAVVTGLAAFLLRRGSRA